MSDQSRAVERAVAGAVLVCGIVTADQVLTIVRDDDFDDADSRAVIAAARQMRNAGIPVDAILLAGWVDRTRQSPHLSARRTTLHSMLADLASRAPVSVSAGWYAVQVVEAAGRRTVDVASRAMQEALQDGSAESLAHVVTVHCERALAAIQRSARCHDVPDRAPATTVEGSGRAGHSLPAEPPALRAVR